MTEEEKELKKLCQGDKNVPGLANCIEWDVDELFVRVKYENLKSFVNEFYRITGIDSDFCLDDELIAGLYENEACINLSGALLRSYLIDLELIFPKEIYR